MAPASAHPPASTRYSSHEPLSSALIPGTNIEITYASACSVPSSVPSRSLSHSRTSSPRLSDVEIVECPGNYPVVVPPPLPSGGGSSRPLKPLRLAAGASASSILTNQELPP